MIQLDYNKLSTNWQLLVAGFFRDDYFPGGEENAIHDVVCWRKVVGIANDVLAGGYVPAYLVDKEKSLTGTHRRAAGELFRYLELPNMVPWQQLDSFLDSITREEGLKFMELVSIAQAEDDWEEVDNFHKAVQSKERNLDIATQGGQ